MQFTAFGLSGAELQWWLDSVTTIAYLGLGVVAALVIGSCVCAVMQIVVEKTEPEEMHGAH